MSQRRLERVTDQFIDWAKDLIPDGELDSWTRWVRLLLRGRAEYLDRPEPALWRSGDVHRVLMELVVARLVDSFGLADRTPEIVGHLLRFLDTTGDFHPSSTRAATLQTELDRWRPRFRDALADPTNFRLAKRIFIGMAADGVAADASDAQLDRWAAEFTARDYGGRKAVLGELIERPGYADGTFIIHEGQVAVLRAGSPPDKTKVWPNACDCDDCRAEAQVPTVKPDGRLTTDVSRSAYLRRLWRLAEWVGPNTRPLDKRGEPLRRDLPALAALLDCDATGARTISDAPTLAAMWSIAVEVDLIVIRRDGVVRGSAWELMCAAVEGRGGTDAVRLWDDVYGELAHPTTTEFDVGPLIARSLGLLFQRDGKAVFTNLIDDVVDQELDDNPLRVLASALLYGRLFLLAEHGAVQIERDGVVQTTDALADLLLDEPDESTRIVLTDLGRYAVLRRWPAAAELTTA